MAIKAAIFDFDGTLFDSQYVWSNFTKRYVENKGLVYHTDVNFPKRKLTLPEACQALADKYPELGESRDQIIMGVEEMVGVDYKFTVQPTPGAPEFLADLCAHGVKCGIASLTSEVHLRNAVNRCGLSEYISAYATVDEVGHSKREPHVYDVCLERLGVLKTEGVYVFEDARYAMETAKNAGYHVVGLVGGNRQCKTASTGVNGTCDFVINDFVGLKVGDL